MIKIFKKKPQVENKMLPYELQRNKCKNCKYGRFIKDYRIDCEKIKSGSFVQIPDYCFLYEKKIVINAANSSEDNKD